MQLTSPPFTGTLSSGQFLAPDGAVAAPGYAFASEPGLGWFRSAASVITAAVAGARALSLTTANLRVRSDGAYGFASTTDSTVASDTRIRRAAAGVILISTGGSGAGGFSSAADTPAALGANTNDYSPGAGYFQRWSAAPAVNVTGMVAGADGEMRYIWNVGANNITLTNADVLSAAANRFTTATGAALVLTPNKCVLAVYDTTSAVWRATLLP